MDLEKRTSDAEIRNGIIEGVRQYFLEGFTSI